MSFIIIGFVLFLMVKAYNRAAKPVAADAGPSEVDLLTEIRDSLKRQSTQAPAPFCKPLTPPRVGSTLQNGAGVAAACRTGRVDILSATFKLLAQTEW